MSPELRQVGLEAQSLEEAGQETELLQIAGLPSLGNGGAGIAVG